MSLNSAQIQAIAHKDGPCMVLAGPGSGKTTVITRRIKYLIEKHHVKPEEILVVTFSKAASKEMKERFHELNGNKKYPVTFGTFHGIYYGILKWAYHLTGENILSEEEKYQILSELTEQLSPDMAEEKEFVQELLTEISYAKNGRTDPEEHVANCCETPVFRKLYQAYEAERESRKKIDFDDMILLTLQLFLKREDILKRWQETYKYILIDEFQDINQAQYDVIKMLARPENNLFIVGDDDQSIYRFRGAKPEIMLDFPNQYPDAKQILLDANYRSTKVIIKGSERVIGRNTKRFQKHMNTVNEHGNAIHIQEVKHPIEESHYVVGEIQKIIKSGVKPKEIAVLFRTNIDARSMIETCMEYNISFHMKEHIPNIYEHFVARNIMAYVKMALGDRTRRTCLSIMNRPNRYISRESINKAEISFGQLKLFYKEKEWMQERLEQWETDLLVIKRCTPYAAVRYIREKVGYDEYLKKYAEKRKISFEDLEDIAREIQERAKEFQTLEEWLAHIEHYTRVLHEKTKCKEADPQEITFMTMHGAKGLEFYAVFIIGANEGVVPYKKAKTKEDIEEERRLFYVAMTRAKKRLTVSYSREQNGKKKEASRFVKELLEHE